MADTDFTIGISTDLKGFMQGIKQAKANFNTLGKDASRALKTPQADIEALSKQLTSFANVAKGALAGFAGAVGIKSLTTDFMNFHTNLANATQVMGYDVTNLEALGSAMRRFGGDTSGAISSLDSLSNALQQASWGQGALVETAQKYGITYMKSNGQLMDSEELLRSLSSELNTFDSYTKRAIASSLGLDEALLRVIDTGNFSELIQHQKNLNATTQEDLKVATEFESAWLDLKDTLASFAKQISRIIIPPLTTLMKYITRVMGTFNNLKDRSTIAWTAIGAAMIPVTMKMVAFGQTLAGVVSTFGLLGKGTTAIKAIGSALGGLTKPAMLIRAAFGMLFLILEDLAVYQSGGKSLFGVLAEKMPFLEKIGGGITETFKYLGKTLDDIIKFFKDPSWANLEDIFKPQIELVKDLFGGLFKWIKDTFLGILDDITGFIKDPLGGIKDLGSWGLSKVSAGWDSVTSFFGGNKQAPELPPTALPPAVLQGTTGTGVVLQNNNTFEIKSTDPVQAGQEVGKVMHNQLQDNQGVLMKYQKGITN